MKKLWINTVPGKDKNADQIFYFPQELPKYLRGYHKTSKQDLAELAALIYRARYGSDQSLLPQVTHMLEEFIPADMLRVQSNSQWKSAISAAYLQQGPMSENDAKEKFLKKIYQLPTFGTAFFEVKQTSDPSYPEMVVVGINRNGVSVIHPQSRVSSSIIFQFMNPHHQTSLLSFLQRNMNFPLENWCGYKRYR